MHKVRSIALSTVPDVAKSDAWSCQARAGQLAAILAAKEAEAVRIRERVLSRLAPQRRDESHPDRSDGSHVPDLHEPAAVQVCVKTAHACDAACRACIESSAQWRC